MKHVEMSVKKMTISCHQIKTVFPLLAFCKRPDNGKFESWYADELTAKNTITAFADADKTAGQSGNYSHYTQHAAHTDINIILLLSFHEESLEETLTE